MKNKLFLTLLVILMSINYSTAQYKKTVQVTRIGSLKELLSNDINRITELTVIGHINFIDFNTIQEMTALRILDISNATLTDNRLKHYNLKGVTLDKLILPKVLLKIEGGAFQDANIKSIDFSNCSELKSIESSFSGFRELKVIDLSNNLKLENMGSHIFKDLSIHVILPKNITSINSGHVFGYFSGTIEYPQSFTTIGQYWFQRSPLKEITIPPSVTSIEKGTFNYCPELHKVILPPSLKIIEDFTFYGCPKLVDLSFLPKGLTTIKQQAFRECVGLKKITLPENLTTIGYQAFRACTGLKKITLPASLKMIETNAFGDCSSLNQIISLNPIPPQLGNAAFIRVNKETCELIVPKGSEDLYRKADQWKEFANINKATPLTKLNLIYTEDGGKTIKDVYTGIRIGEYYWMNRNFNGVSDVNGVMPPITKEEVDYIHKTYTMFNFDYCTPGKPTYWSYGPKIEDINKYYGQYISNHQATGIMLQDPNIKLIEDENPLAEWSIPDYHDALQLFGMCGNATVIELSQYLGYQYDKDKIQPSVVIPYHFLNTTGYGVNWSGHITNGYKKENSNKYGFNWLPGGVRFHSDGTAMTITCDGRIIPFTAYKNGLNGFDQTYQMRLKNGFKISLNDVTGIDYLAQAEYQTVRWCRLLTDQELGYKLYINQTDFTDSRRSLLNLRDRLNSGKSVIIEKKGLNESPSKGFIELPKGFLRGFYVQYILNKAIPEKTISELINIALQHLYVYPASDTEIRSTLTPLRLDESNNVSVYPNPTSDVLNIKGNDIQKIEIYDLNGRFIRSTTDTPVSVHELGAGMYVIRVITPEGVSNHKIVKK